MKIQTSIVFLAIVLAACAPAQTKTTNVQNAAIAAAWTEVSLTQTAMSSIAPPLSTFTSTLELTPVPATLIPTQPPIPILTPDVVQIERWREYQTELAKRVFSDVGADASFFDSVICEWDILGRSGQEVYIWALCGTPGSRSEKPAVVYLQMDGAIEQVKVPVYTLQTSNENELFPADVLEKIHLYEHSPRALTELRSHLEERLLHPEIPPLIVLLAPPVATPTP